MKPISICAPYWNRPTEWARAKASYDRVYRDLDLEFSICDDGSHAPLRDRDKRVRITRLAHKNGALNPCVPINVAVRQSTHDIIVLTNPEIEHRERVLDRMLEALTGPNDYVMTGCKNAAGRHGLRIVQDEWIAGPEAPRAPLGGRQPIPPGAHLHFCVMFHRALFERAGGFDESYRHGFGSEDNDWLWKLWSLGDVNFKYVPGCVWHHRTPHRWGGAPGSNVELLHRKWGDLEEFRCAS